MFDGRTGNLGVVTVVDRHVRRVGDAGALVRALDLGILFFRDVLQLVMLVRAGRVELGLRDGGEAVLEEPARESTRAGSGATGCGPWRSGRTMRGS